MEHRFPVKAAAGGAGAFRQGGYPVINGDFTKIGCSPGLGTPFICAHLKMQQVQVGQVSGGLHQKRRVGIVAVVFKGRETTIHPKITAVQNQVAFNPVNAHAPQFPESAPQSLKGELGVATETHIQVALQGIANHRAVGQEVGIPVVSRAQQFQSGVGGDQLHDGARAHQFVSVHILLNARPVKGNGCNTEGLLAIQGLVCVVFDLTGPETGFRKGCGSGTAFLGQGRRACHGAGSRNGQYQPLG